MKKNNSRQNFLQRAATYALVIGSLALAGDGNAQTATGTATATVLEAVTIIIIPPPIISPPPLPVPEGIERPPAVSDTVATPEEFLASQSPSAPLLRALAPPPEAAETAAQSEAAAQSGSTGAGAAAPSDANSTIVTVTINPDGTVSASGAPGLKLTVSQPDADGVVKITIEHN